MADEHLKKALIEQEQELEKLDAQLAGLKPLQARRDALFSLVSNMRYTLGMEPYHMKATEPVTDAPFVVKRSIWEASKDVLEKSGVPMAPGEIAQVLVSLGYKTLAGRPGRETIRTLLTKKKGVFRKIDGKFELIK